MYLNYVCIACTFGAATCRITMNKSDVGRQCCIYIHQRAEANVHMYNMQKLHIIGSILGSRILNDRNKYHLLCTGFLKIWLLILYDLMQIFAFT